MDLNQLINHYSNTIQNSGNNPQLNATNNAQSFASNVSTQMNSSHSNPIQPNYAPIFHPQTSMHQPSAYPQQFHQHPQRTGYNIPIYNFPQAYDPHHYSNYNVRNQQPQQQQQSYNYYYPVQHPPHIPPKPSGPPSHLCVPCEKEFYSESQYQKHVEKHQVCDEPGCNFKATLRVIKHHKLTVHNPFVQRMMKLQSPEEIAKYIEERKAKYPTKENVQKRLEEEQKKRERGEIIEENGPFKKKKRSKGKTNRPCKYFKRGKCTKGDQCAFRHDEKGKKELNIKTKSSSSLLETLFEKEITLEKSTILQCFRYIVKNNFFLDNEAKDSKKVDQNTETLNNEMFEDTKNDIPNCSQNLKDESKIDHKDSESFQSRNEEGTIENKNSKDSPMEDTKQE